MRVVFLTHNYPRTSGDMAGGFLHPLARTLCDRGVELRIVAPADRGEGGRDSLDGVPIVRVRYGTPEQETLAYTGNMAGAGRSIEGMLSLRRLIHAMRKTALAELQDSPSGLVHAHWWIPAGIAAPRSKPLILTCHGTDVRLLEKSPLIAWLARPVFRRARRVTVVSRDLAQVVEQQTGISVPENQVVPMPLPPVERINSRGGGGLVVIGRLSTQKRVDLALRAYRKMRQSGYQGALTIVGDGPEMPRLQTMAKELELGKQVSFTGAVPPAEIPKFLTTADLALMPARGEGLGLAGAEALIQGVPLVICSDGGGLLDLFSPESPAGAVVAPDPEAISSAAMTLLSSTTARAAAGKAGTVWRYRLSPDFVAEQFLTWYREALQ